MSDWPVVTLERRIGSDHVGLPSDRDGRQYPDSEYSPYYPAALLEQVEEKLLLKMEAEEQATEGTTEVGFLSRGAAQAFQEAADLLRSVREGNKEPRGAT